MLAAAFADRDVLGVRGERDRLRMDERVVEHDVGALEHVGRAQRQQIRRAGTGADEIDRARAHAAVTRPRRAASRLRKSGSGWSTEAW